MKALTRFHFCRRMLIHILKRPGDASTDMEEALNEALKEDCIDCVNISCLLTVLTYSLCAVTDFNEAKALEGVRAVLLDVENDVRRVCSGEEPPKNYN